MLRECRRIYTNAGNTAGRLKKFNGLDAEPLYHPPHLADRLAPGSYGDYVLGVGRLETVKRAHLAIEAMTRVDRPIELRLAGDGTQRANLEALASRARRRRPRPVPRRPSTTRRCWGCMPARSAVAYVPTTRTSAM